MAKPIRRSLARRLGRNIGDRRRAVGLTQEQLAEYLEIDTLTVSRYEIGNILPPLTVVDVVARLLNTGEVYGSMDSSRSSSAREERAESMTLVHRGLFAQRGEDPEGRCAGGSVAPRL